MVSSTFLSDTAPPNSVASRTSVVEVHSVLVPSLRVTAPANPLRKNSPSLRRTESTLPRSSRRTKRARLPCRLAPAPAKATKSPKKGFFAKFLK
ncbi:hypothetical protein OPQ81_007238 [Rhizoctonia solani]|nr:hypothetical protein OPQ81_007238 [Rhizoctonia solani]